MEENEEPVCGPSKETKEIQTFIFLDIEATGLKYDCPKIMEIALVAVSRNDLLAASREYFEVRKTKASICKNLNKEPNENGKRNEGKSYAREMRESRVPVLPRVLHKYTRLYYPKRFVRPAIEEMTDLNNYSLEHLPCFAEDSVDALNLFVNLPRPVAFVAHNGHKYDFPLLKAEFIQADRPNTCSSVLCVDSYKAFLSLDNENEELEELSNMVINDMTSIENPSSSFENPSKRRKCDDLPAEDQTDHIGNETEMAATASSSFFTPEKSFNKEILEAAAMTPVKKQRPLCAITTPNPENKSDSAPVTSRSTFPCRKLDYNHSDSKNTILNNKSKNSKRISYQQIDIFERLFNSSYRAHSAEGDSLALLQICCHYGKRFTDWADGYASSFETVKPMWVKKS